jgi:hypothetical protein
MSLDDSFTRVEPSSELQRLKMKHAEIIKKFLVSTLVRRFTRFMPSSSPGAYRYFEAMLESGNHGIK